MELCPIQEAAQAHCFPGSLASRLLVSVRKPGKSTESPGPRHCFSLGSVATPPSSTLGGCVGPQCSLWMAVGSKWEGPAGEGPCTASCMTVPAQAFPGSTLHKAWLREYKLFPHKGSSVRHCLCSLLFTTHSGSLVAFFFFLFNVTLQLSHSFLGAHIAKATPPYPQHDVYLLIIIPRALTKGRASCLVTMDTTRPRQGLHRKGKGRI